MIPVRWLGTTVSVAVLVFFGLVGCGVSSSTNTVGCYDPADPSAHPASEKPCTTSVSQEPEAPTTTTTAAVADVPMPYVARMRESTDDGYSAEVTLRRGKLMRPAGQKNGDVVVGSGCEVDAKTAVVEPFEMTIKNTTKGYALRPGFILKAKSPLNNLPPISAEVNYGGAPECSGQFVSSGLAESHGVGLVPHEPLEPGESISLSGFLIVDGYFSPKYAHGDRKMLKDIIMQIHPDLDVPFTKARYKGMLPTQANGYVLSFDPERNGGCIVDPPCPAPYQTASPY